VPADDVYQSELEELATLKRRRKAIDAELKARQKGILDRLERGAVVQAGRYQATRSVSHPRQLTFKVLVDLLGEEFVSDLREDLPVRTSIRLNLRESKSRRGPGGRESGSRPGW
jgi:hypothetical protein